MIRIETESILEAQQSAGEKAIKGDVLVRRRRLVFAPEMIGQIAINLPSKVGIYSATTGEIDEQVDELGEFYGEDLAATGAVWGSPIAGRTEPILTLYSDATEAQKEEIRNIVGIEITLLTLASPAPRP